jgi:hypothetical protein
MAAASRKKRAIESHVLNQNEVSVNRRIQHDYNLKLEDFDTELEYDSFLEERERVIYNLVHNIEIPETEELIAAFKLKHHVRIERRNAEAMERGRSGGNLVVPLLAEVKTQSHMNIGHASMVSALALSYSDGGFLAEIKRRPDQWQEHPELSVERAGGMSQDWIQLKARQEFFGSLVRPDRKTA